MKVYQTDPTKDARWAEFLAQHPRSSVFHTAGWLNTLRQSYGYEPVAFTTSPPGSELRNGLVCCQIDSWLTGSRIVSLPFSDHCEPLTDSPEETGFLVDFLRNQLKHRGWKYFEVRPVNPYDWRVYRDSGMSPAGNYFLHFLDLRPELNSIFRNLHVDSVQRRVRRAQRAGLVEKCGASGELLEAFYQLFIGTRRRHHLPPIPLPWFRNLIESLKNAVQIRLAYKEGAAIAGMLTLRWRDTVVYKYGCSNAKFNKFGATPWLLWNAISEAKSRGACKFDMGRTDEEMIGLLKFKNHWVPQPHPVTYWRVPYDSSAGLVFGWKLKVVKQVFSLMPESLLRVTGNFVYRHIG